MPNTITSIYSFTAGHTALSAQFNENFNNLRGSRIPLDMSIQSAATSAYDIGRPVNQWKDLYYKGEFYVDGIKNIPIPIGTIIETCLLSAPSNYLACDGSSISRTTYSNLFTAITNGTETSPAFGYETSTHFNLPDLRGKFVRTVDSGAGNDPDSASRTAQGTNGNTGDTLGSVQSYATANPTSELLAITSGGHIHNETAKNSVIAGGLDALGAAVYLSANWSVTIAANSFTHSHSLLGGDNESRPINSACYFYIRY